ncbi:MAG TPA: response regulator [Nitrospirota bacterium]|nr:response regulator [Nitrospirota bacterium]
MGIAILLADDHKLMREGLRTLIEEQPDMSVVAEAEDGVTAVRLASELSPDLIIMDISMPEKTGIEAARQIAADKPGLKIIALSMHLDKRMVLEMFDSGAAGYLIKDCAFEEVILAIQTVMSNGVYLCPKIADIMIKDYSQNLAKIGDSARLDLSSDETKILQLMCEGENVREIASHFEMSIATAEYYCQRLIVNYIVPQLQMLAGGLQSNAKSGQTIWLTSREKEILMWVKEGKSTWEISLIIGVSKDTVKFHMKNIFHKLNANSRSQAISVAIANKLIDL